MTMPTKKVASKKTPAKKVTAKKVAVKKTVVKQTSVKKEDAGLPLSVVIRRRSRNIIEKTKKAKRKAQN